MRPSRVRRRRRPPARSRSPPTALSSRHRAVTIVPGASVASVNVTATAGTHNFGASYPGDGNYNRELNGQHLHRLHSSAARDRGGHRRRGGRWQGPAPERRSCLSLRPRDLCPDSRPADGGGAPLPPRRPPSAAARSCSREATFPGAACSSSAPPAFCRAVSTSGAPRCNAAAALAGPGPGVGGRRRRLFGQRAVELGSLEHGRSRLFDGRQ